MKIKHIDKQELEQYIGICNSIGIEPEDLIRTFIKSVSSVCNSERMFMHFSRIKTNLHFINSKEFDDILDEGISEDLKYEHFQNILKEEKDAIRKIYSIFSNKNMSKIIEEKVDKESFKRVCEDEMLKSLREKGERDIHGQLIMEKTYESGSNKQ